jgi:hypothetical protein
VPNIKNLKLPMRRQRAIHATAVLADGIWRPFPGNKIERIVPILGAAALLHGIAPIAKAFHRVPATLKPLL